MNRTIKQQIPKYLPKDYRSDIKPSWCKGCYNYGVLKSLIDVLSYMQLAPSKVNIISGIGCSSRLPLFLKTFGIHSVHGRAIPIAIGARLAKPDIPVIVTAGDGDLFSIGISHFVHAARKNFNITVICMDNRIFAMTKNQGSPTSSLGYKGTLTPFGKISLPLNVLEFSIACEASFVAQTYAGKLDSMFDLFTEAIKHKGFSFVNVISPCILHNRNKLKYFDNKLIDINKELKHDPSDKMIAISHALRALDYDNNSDVKVPIGIFYKKNYNCLTFEEKVDKIKKKYFNNKYNVDQIFQRYKI